MAEITSVPEITPIPQTNQREALVVGGNTEKLTKIIERPKGVREPTGESAKRKELLATLALRKKQGATPRELLTVMARERFSQNDKESLVSSFG
ncbi:MAG: hypothetical protein M1308_00535, partial [Actinobacteria bacterium]|nr:hypothetical protein [Actinomycetota bacterium]